MSLPRGKSLEPDSRPQYLTRRQMRARSAGPASNRASRIYNSQDNRSSSLPRNDPNRALINQHVNPYQEFPSLRRGFTLEGMPIMEKDEHNPDFSETGDAFAYYFWAIGLFFFALALINFIVLMVIIHVLEISPYGMEAVEFMPEIGSVKFLKDLFATVITVGSGLISGFSGEPLNIVAENGDIVFQVRQGSHGNEPQLRISPFEVSLANIDNFRVLDPESGKIYFDAFAPEFDISNPIESLAAKEVETNRLVSPINEDLFIKSDAKLDLTGAEGIKIEGKNVNFDAGQDVSITSTTGSITLKGGVVLDPLALPVGGGGYPGETAQFKLCICGKSGKIFAVPVLSKSKNRQGSGLACLHSVEGQKHPCDDQ